MAIILETASLKLSNPVLGPWQDGDVDVVYIPEYTLRSTSILGLQSIVSGSSVRSQVLEFEYKYAGEPVWPNLSRRGSDLLDCLIRSQRYIGEQRRRLVLVSHGLGGLVAKQAILQLHTNGSDAVFTSLLEVYIGAVFLGTPHPTIGRKDEWIRLSLILRSFGKFRKDALAQAELDAWIVANLSDLFNRAAIDSKTITVFEQKATKISHGWLKSKRQVFVDRAFSEIGLRNEIIIGSNDDHADIGRLVPGTAVARQLDELLKSRATHILALGASQSVSAGISQINLSGDDWTSEFSPQIATHGTSNTQDTEVSALKDFSSNMPRAPSLPCYMLDGHSENTDFVGRLDVLVSLESKLEPTHHTPSTDEQVNSLRSVVIYGFGGVGKTQIALRYAYSSMKAKRFDVILWMNADGNDGLAASFQQAVIDLKLIEAKEASDTVVARNVLMEWLSNPYQTSTNHPDGDADDGASSLANWLIIFDNADDPVVLRDYWPVSGNGSVIVTSRDPQAGTYLHSVNTIELQFLDIADSSVLIRKLAPTMIVPPQDETLFTNLCTKLGGFPLALVLFSAIVSRNQYTVREALHLHDELSFESRLFTDKILSPYDHYQHTLSTVWAANQLKQESVFLLDILSILNPDSIAERILQTRTGSTQIESLTTMQNEFQIAKQDLLRSSLITRHRGRSQQHEELLYLKLHRVVQEWVRGRMTAARKQLVFRCTVEVLLAAWQHDSEEKFTHLKALWGTAQITSPHIQRLMAIYKEDHKSWQLDAKTEGDFSRLLQKSGWYLFETGYPESASPLLHLALKLCEPHVQQNEMKVLHADILFSLATFCADQNHPSDSLVYAEQHFRVRMDVEKQKPALGRHAGLAYTEMGLGLLLNNRFEEAINYCRQGRTILVELPLFKEGKYWPDFAVIHEALSLMGLHRYREAIPILQEAIEFRARRYGPNDTESFKLGFHLQLLANVHYYLQQWTEAKHLYVLSLSNYRETVGDHYFRTSQVCVKLAQCHARESQMETANIYFEQALKNFGLHSFTKPELARTKYLKARFLEQNGMMDDAATILEEAQTLYTEVTHTSDRSVLDNLGLNDFDSIVPLWSR